MVNLTMTLSSLITANHILHYNDVIDGFGHVSVRSPLRNDTFYLSGYRAPALVSSPQDLIEYYVANASAVDPNAGRGYTERYIHSEVYKRFPDMNCVIHAHDQNVVPFTIVGGIEMEPAYHMAGFLGTSVPNYDIAAYYNSTSTHDMLVSSVPLGAALASYFVTPAHNHTSNITSPDHPMVLMRGHGYTTTDSTIETAVYRAIYAQSNAHIQTTALQLAAAAGVAGGASGMGANTTGVRYLSQQERMDTSVWNHNLADRPWPMWVREVEVNPLYVNTLGPLPTS